VDYLNNPREKERDVGERLSFLENQQNNLTSLLLLIFEFSTDPRGFPVVNETKNFRNGNRNMRTN